MKINDLDWQPLRNRIKIAVRKATPGMGLEKFAERFIRHADTVGIQPAPCIGLLLASRLPPAILGAGLVKRQDLPRGRIAQDVRLADVDGFDPRAC